MASHLEKRRAKILLENRTMLAAAMLNNYELLKTKLDSKYVNVDFEDLLGASAIHYAALNGNKDMIRLLAKHGCDINAKANSGVTALFVAARLNASNTVKTLLRHGADPTLRNNNGLLPVAVTTADHCVRLLVRATTHYTRSMTDSKFQYRRINVEVDDNAVGDEKDPFFESLSSSDEGDEDSIGEERFVDISDEAVDDPDATTTDTLDSSADTLDSSADTLDTTADTLDTTDTTDTTDDASTSNASDDDDDGRVLVVPPLETTGQDLDGVHQVFVIGSDAGESGYGSLDYSFEEAIERNTQLNARTRFPRLEPGEAATGTSGYYYSSTGGYVYGSGSGSYYQSWD